MIRLLDDLQRELLLPRPPRRIISLVPSDTLNLFALGAGDRLVGRTRFCVAPRGAVESIAVVGGTKDVQVEEVLRLQPDLVLANQEENARGPIGALIRSGLPVLVTFPRTVGEGIGQLARLARLLGVAGEPAVRELLRRGLAELAAADRALVAKRPLKAFVPIWRDPLMTAANETFLHDALRLAGAANVFGDRKRRTPLAAEFGNADPSAPPLPTDRDARYPRIAEQELLDRAPEIVLLPDEPYAFGEADLAHFGSLPLPAAREGKIRLVSGRDLTWHGVHSLEALPRLRALVDSLR
jgi:ABC-type Fe3+-hydroxamate transport system substrate-binding protein